MDELDQKLNATFDGKVLRKDLLHRIKKGTNVPTFVLEFLLAKYCASNDQAEMDAGMEAVLSSLQENYVRPDEANAAQLSGGDGGVLASTGGSVRLRKRSVSLKIRYHYYLVRYLNYPIAAVRCQSVFPASLLRARWVKCCPN